MTFSKHYHYSKSIEEALLSLKNSAGVAKVLAGGTDLLLDLQQGRLSDIETLVDITNIPELNLLEIRGDDLFIGAAVLHRDITNSPTVRNHAETLAEACGLIGGPQVRNVATLGGNVAHALPAADGTIALMALDAKVEIASLESNRIIPMVDIFSGPGKSTLDPKNDLLVGFYIKLKKEKEGSSFKRIMRPQGVAIAILNAAVWLSRKDEKIKDIRISFGPSGPTPKRLSEVENALRGKNPNTAEINEAYRILLETTNFRTSKHRASQEYRNEMAGVLLRDTINLAWERAGS